MVGRPLRADARHSEEALLEAAKQVFARSGVDAPIREIAGLAGVGLATLYRRFPKRSDLIAAVFRREMDACVAAAAALRASAPPREALARWLMRYTEFIATKQGLSTALRSGAAAFDALPAYFRASFEPALTELLAAAATTGTIRDDIAAWDLLRAIGNLSDASGPDAEAHVHRMVGLLIDGLGCVPAAEAAS